MTYDEYDEELNTLVAQYHEKIKNLKDRYKDANAKFKVGDFVGNVTGIIKVDKVSAIGGTKRPPSIVYKGKAYKRRGGLLFRTQSNRVREMHEEDLKLVPEVINNP